MKCMLYHNVQGQCPAGGKAQQFGAVETVRKERATEA